MMAYYFNTMLPGPFDEAVARTVAALKEEAFGIITEIDVQKTLHEKIGVAFRKYRILGACNPKLAHQALKPTRANTRPSLTPSFGSPFSRS